MKFSLIIPTYNRMTILERCVNSILNQDYPKNKYEIIIVDDGSSDDTEKLIKNLKLRYSNIKYIKHSKNKGVAAARNTGIKNARGEFISIIADDYILPSNYIKDQLEFFRLYKKAKVVRVRIDLANKFFFPKLSQAIFDFNIASILYEKNIKNKKILNYYQNKIISSFDLPASGASIFKKDIFKKINFNEDLKMGEDSEFGLKLKKGKIPIFYNPKIIIKRTMPQDFITHFRKRYSAGFWSTKYGKSLFSEKDLIILIPRIFINSLYTYRFIKNKNILYIPFLILAYFLYEIGRIEGTLENKIHINLML